MKITKVTWARTVSKDYQSKRAEYEIELQPGDDPATALQLAKALVDEALGEGPKPAEVEKARAIVMSAEQAGEAMRRFLKRNLPK